VSPYLTHKGSLLNLISVSRNADIVEIGGYVGITADMTNSNPPGGYHMNFNNLVKIRSTTPLTKIKFRAGDASVTTSFWLQVWRMVAGVYTVIYEEDIKSKITDNSINEITLAQSVSVLEGDMLSLGADTAIATPVVAYKVISTDNSWKRLTATKPATGTDWGAVTGGQAVCIPIISYGQAPLIVKIGDSHPAGHPGNFSGIEDSLLSVPANTIGGQLALIDSKYVYQNMGIGSQTTGSIQARFAADCVALKPKFALINGGANDLLVTPKATYLAKWALMLDDCAANNIIPVVLKMFPSANWSAENCATKADWMNDLQVLVATYTGSIWIDLDSTIGQFRAGGDAGNLWDLKTSMDSGDHVHINLSGYAATAAKVDTEIKKKYKLV
jgi:lysophospholipase L1-like esterase